MPANNKKSSVKNSDLQHPILTRSQKSRQNIDKALASEGDIIHGESIYSNLTSGDQSILNGSNVVQNFRSETSITLTPSATVTVRKGSLPCSTTTPLSTSYCNLSILTRESLLDTSSFSSSLNHCKSSLQAAKTDIFEDDFCTDGTSAVKHDGHTTLTGPNILSGSISGSNHSSVVYNDSHCSPPIDGVDLPNSSTPAPSHPLNRSFPELNLSHEGKLDKIISLIETNSAEIKSLRTDFNFFKSTQTKVLLDCEKKLKGFDERLNSEINTVKLNCQESLARVKSEIQQEILSKFDQCSCEQADMYDYVDDRINEKFCELDDHVAPRLVTAGINIDKQINSCKESLQSSVSNHVQSYLSSVEGKEYLTGIMTSHTSPSSSTCQLIDDAYTQLRSEVMEIIGQLKFMQCQFIEELRLVKENGSFVTVASGVSDTQITSKKIDKITAWVESLQHQLAASSKVVSSLDLKSRKANLIFDGIPEEPKEDLFHILGSLLNQFVPGFDFNSIDNAFRLGKSSINDNSSRRVLVSFNSTQAREAVLGLSGVIARAGPPGGRIYINEDIPEDVKRRRADVFKYVNYMYEKGHNIVQKGDCVLLNNTLYKYEDLSSMPKGMTLADSRTIAKKGVIAFQSPHSPFSNLYIAPIKRNGIIYQSAEHAFQHAKAVHCKDHVLARAILCEPNPFDAMAIGKRVEITDDWPDCQLNVMSKILQAKLEQVPAFHNALKSSDKHHLVENTRSLYWGAGTPYNSDRIFNRTYPGKNKLGYLLEEIREKF